MRAISSMDIKNLAGFEKVIINNIGELFEESKWLHRLGHYPRAYTLSHLAFEENAKITFLTFLAWDIFAGKEFSNDEVEKIFRSQLFTDHKLKLKIAFLKLPGFDYQKSVQQINALNILKNKSIYADMFEGEICKPSDFFGNNQSSAMIEITKNTLQKRIEELGFSQINHIKKITNEVIENYYHNMKSLFDSQFQLQNWNYVEYLKDIIKNENLFNKVKRTFET
jgi:AbiV family abortive infection protein